MKKVILFGGGDSIREGESKGLYDKIKGKEIWSLNYAHLTMPYLPSRELFVDTTFLEDNEKMLNKLNEQGVPIYTRKLVDNYPDYIKTYECERELDKLKKDMLFVGRLGLVGTFALSLALEEEYDEIFLLGYDYGTKDKKNTQTHYYQGKLDVISSGVGVPDKYLTEEADLGLKDFEYLINVASGKAIKIYNVSMISKIQCIPKVTWEQFFIIIK